MDPLSEQRDRLRHFLFAWFSDDDPQARAAKAAKVLADPVLTQRWLAFQAECQQASYEDTEMHGAN